MSTVARLLNMTALDFARAEMEAIHEALTELEVPDQVDGEPLSASQRVVVLIGAYKSACERVGRGG